MSPARPRHRTTRRAAAAASRAPAPRVAGAESAEATRGGSGKTARGRGAKGSGTARERRPSPPDALAGSDAAAPRSLWQVGLGALSRVGSEPLPGAELVAGVQDGFRRLEEVFDERVAAALRRLGVPSTQDVDGLAREVRALAAEVERLKRRIARQ